MPKKKIAKKKKVAAANKQRQNVNVKIKIDQSRRTNPREPRQAVKGSLPSRAYTANSSTPLHTTIMTATPSPAILQKEPHYAETVKNMFQEAEKRQNNQLQKIADYLSEREQNIIDLLDENAKYAPQPVDQLYDTLVKEYHQRRVKKEEAEQSKSPATDFQDPHAKAKSRLTPVRSYIPGSDYETANEENEAGNMAPPTATKRRRGRPPLSDEEKARRAEARREAKERIESRQPRTRASVAAGASSPLVRGLFESSSSSSE